MHRTWAIIERELRRFRRSPSLIVMSLVFPLVQLVVLGYAFGGNVKHLKLAIVDQDHGAAGGAACASWPARWPPTRRRSDRELRRPRARRSPTCATGRVNGVLTIPPDFSRRVPAEARAAPGAHRGQHRQLRRGDAGRDR